MMRILVGNFRLVMKAKINLLGDGCWVARLIGTLTGCSKNDRAETGEEATLPEINRALTTWGMMNSGPSPKTVYDLTNSPALKGKRPPTPPAGKKLALDAAKRQVVIVDQ